MQKMTPPVRGWHVQLDVSANVQTPRYLQIVRALVHDIQRGRLRPGARLPGSRALCASLGVDRGTVELAYDELCAEGWVEVVPNKGTFVAAQIKPWVAARKPASGVATGVETATVSSARTASRRASQVLNMAGGSPDLREAPVAMLWRAHRRVLQRHAVAALSYGDSAGALRLREALADMLSQQRALVALPGDLMVTRGSQMALYLVGRVATQPGDLVAVEALGYRAAWEALACGGAQVEPVRVDRHGLVVEDLERMAALGKLRAVYVTPHHHYPTLATLTASRRLALLELARRKRFWIIEDDYDHEFHYTGRPVAPLASLAGADPVIYVGSLAKVLAPGLRLGYLKMPPPLREKLVAYRARIDQQGDTAMECAVAELIEDGELQRHARRMRRLYQLRQSALAEALRAQLSDCVQFRLPSGGMALWIDVKRGVDVTRWAARALERGVAFTPGRAFSFKGHVVPHARVGFAAVTPEEIDDGVARMRAAL